MLYQRFYQTKRKLKKNWNQRLFSKSRAKTQKNTHQPFFWEGEGREGNQVINVLCS
jgi:hypothetical protein